MKVECKAYHGHETSFSDIDRWRPFYATFGSYNGIFIICYNEMILFERELTWKEANIKAKFLNFRYVDEITIKYEQ